MDTARNTSLKSDAPVILPRSEHTISRKQIDKDSLKVLYRLHRHGYKAYLVGGSVRDLLLGRMPKDFDVGTDATPNQVKKLFRNCFLVGRRFRLAHIRFGRDKVIEVATFRREARKEDLPENPADHAYLTENVFGTPQQDAFRRDFTINALFYNIKDFSIVDYVGGLKDLELRRLRVIGDPLVRFAEDPVRMLRALEFCARLDFTLDEDVRKGICARASLIGEAAPARIREELMELFRHRVAGAVLRNSQAMGLLPHLLAGFEGDEATFDLLDRVDERTGAGVTIQEYFALAALHLSRFHKVCYAEGDLTVADALRIAGRILSPHCTYFHVAHGVRHMARELLVGFFRLCRGRGKRGEKRFLHHPATPESFELFSLWVAATGEHGSLLDAWKEVLSPSGQVRDKAKRPPPRRRPRRPRKRRPPKV